MTTEREKRTLRSLVSRLEDDRAALHLRACVVKRRVPRSRTLMRLRFLFLTSILTVCGIAQAAEHIALLGTYTGESRGIYAVRLDSKSGALSAPELVAELSNPEFLALHPNGQIVYALTQISEGGKKFGAVAAFKLETTTGKLSPLNTESSHRGSLTHLAVDGTGKVLVAASYGDGYVASFPLLPDGRVGPCATIINQTGPLGPNKGRQDAPHPHSVTMSPDGRVAYVADLGVDRVFGYDVSSEQGTITPHDPAFATFAPGTGPRHTKFSPDGKSFYVLDELDATITACRFGPSRGVLEPFQRSDALPADFKGKNTASEIRIHPNGRFVYSANRGHDSIAVFSRDEKSGALSRIEVVPSGGQVPRNFNLTPDGGWLLCAHQSTNNLTVFKVDAESGKLTATESSAKVPKSVCVLFVN